MPPPLPVLLTWSTPRQETAPVTRAVAPEAVTTATESASPDVLATHGSLIVAPSVWSPELTVIVAGLTLSVFSSVIGWPEKA
ncbi:MAG: hypothetical protein BWX70_01491 [Verrucomicrobia bacterium ADurb.Bin070]|nr:MAG: hypothetical protein BWX70_01491 [Verrucomicrobia bacterium ADurb.Bin070]